MISSLELDELDEEELFKRAQALSLEDNKPLTEEPKNEKQSKIFQEVV
jgi:hypothetical protein